ncbi:hypothetical protein L5515_010511 [Caenorhabditis briggsae]|uniref:Uncharacterized protein n=1 Tax=Caenorhabditis briggsae TaxID=6238 RepID=A0AAE9ER53_CAEBR|nr:hypothetical protein L5515_010511 [Caenorhabditis briggsae]
MKVIVCFGYSCTVLSKAVGNRAATGGPSCDRAPPAALPQTARENSENGDSNRSQIATKPVFGQSQRQFLWGKSR